LERVSGVPTLCAVDRADRTEFSATATGSGGRSPARSTKFWSAREKSRISSISTCVHPVPTGPFWGDEAMAAGLVTYN